MTELILLSAIVMGLTEVIKRAFNLQKKWVPLTAIVLAICIGNTGIFIDVFHELNLITTIISGLMACGLWSGTKTTIKKSTDKK